jgi:hypothetical protein
MPGALKDVAPVMPETAKLEPVKEAGSGEDRGRLGVAMSIHLALVAGELSVPIMEAITANPNDAGFPENQYVRPYTRRDGTRVDGYYRNSPSDSLPTFIYISC